MEEPEEDGKKTFGRFRLGTLIFLWSLLTLIAAFWISSYFSGGQFYKSTWTPDGNNYSERAIFVFTNFGSFGFGLRTQTVHFSTDPPINESNWRKMPAQKRGTLLNSHWVYHDSKTTPFGVSSSTYSQLWIPFWIPFLILFIITVAVQAGAREKTNE
ncbi:MAG: hypothetical protein HKN23_16970 [Verrucomicrobiales bacterium]|nr:hypothetical protein [Verrucomicrobiales bacterium]